MRTARRRSRTEAASCTGWATSAGQSNATRASTPTRPATSLSVARGAALGVRPSVADHISRDEFSKRFRQEFYDPAFRAHDAAIAAMEEIAWNAYSEGRKAPVTEKAGPEFADPDYDLSVEWRESRDKIRAADARRRDPSTQSRVLVICGSSRNDGTCPGEMSKTFRLSGTVCEQLRADGIETDLLDLSLLTSEPMHRIYPCKGCVATAMPLCHWPCSCYPNHATRQTNDWMAEIYERWSAAHGVILLTPVYWYQVASPLKLMIDRLVCADGGNPDPTRTAGKNADKAKQIELEGWDYPKHLADRVYGVVVHGDVAGIEPIVGVDAIRVLLEVAADDGRAARLRSTHSASSPRSRGSRGRARPAWRRATASGPSGASRRPCPSRTRRAGAGKLERADWPHPGRLRSPPAASRRPPRPLSCW